MDIERIKAVKLLVTLKGMAPDNSQQYIWFPGTVFKKPFPKNIVAELALNRPGVLEIIEEPPSEPKEPEKLEASDAPEKQPEDPVEPETEKETLEDTQDVPPKKPKRKTRKKAG